MQTFQPLYSNDLNVVTTKTTTYAITLADEFIPVDGSSGAFSITLPTAVGCRGKVFQIKRTDNSFANAVTIATTSSQTIDGVTSRRVMTQYEEFTVVSDNSNWLVMSHTYPQGFVSYTPTFTGFGTVSAVNIMSGRRGNSLIVQGRFTAGTTTATPCNMTLGFNGTNGTVTSTSGIGNVTLVGEGGFNVVAAAKVQLTIAPSSGNLLFGVQDATRTGINNVNGSALVNSGDVVFVNAVIPITNWEA